MSKNSLQTLVNLVYIQWFLCNEGLLLADTGQILHTVIKKKKKLHDAFTTMMFVICTSAYHMGSF